MLILMLLSSPRRGHGKTRQNPFWVPVKTIAGTAPLGTSSFVSLLSIFADSSTELLLGLGSGPPCGRGSCCNTVEPGPDEVCVCVCCLSMESYVPCSGGLSPVIDGSCPV